MLRFLSPYVLRCLIDLPFCPESPRIIYNSLSSYTDIHEVVYIDASGHVVGCSDLADELRVRTDIVGLVSYDRTLYLLSSKGVLFRQDGLCVSRGVMYIGMTSRDSKMTVKRGNRWYCFNSYHDIYEGILGILGEWEACALSIPMTATAVSVMGHNAPCYIADNMAYIRWCEDPKVLTLHRNWVHGLGPSIFSMYHLRETRVELPEQQLRNCIWDISCAEVLYTAKRSVTCVQLKEVERPCYGSNGSMVQTAVEGIKIRDPIEFGADIRDTKIFHDSGYTPTENTMCRFAVLLETGEMYMSTPHGVKKLSNQVVEMVTMGDSDLYLLFDDNSLKHYVVGANGEMVEV
jgi:hypothetical protein